MPEDLAPEFPRERPIGSNIWRIMIFQFIENLYIYIYIELDIDYRFKTRCTTGAARV